MLAFNPQQRPSAAEILGNAWLNDNKSPSAEQITPKPARKRDQKKTQLRASTHLKKMKQRSNVEKQICRLLQNSTHGVVQPCPIQEEGLKQSESPNDQILGKRTERVSDQ